MAKKVVFAWGRFNPPTTGHKVVMDRVAKEAKSRQADYIVFASKSNDPKKNPLTFRAKIKFLKQSFPKHAKNINASPKLRTVLDVMKFLDKKYQEVSLVVGADRAQEFKRLLHHYNGREYEFEEIEIISAGERDPDSDDVTGMSASKMRKFAADGNYKEFKKGSPMKNPKPLYDAIRRGMKINEEICNTIIEAHEFDVTDRKVAGRRFNAMLRFGLVPIKDIPITKRAFKDLEQAAPNPELRKYILDVTDKVLEYIMADDLLYRRFLLLLHDDFLMKEDHCDALLKKAEKSQLSYTSLLEVFLRGLAASPIYGDKTAHQHAFDRVNSYIAGGYSRKNLDADIWESSRQKNTGRTPMKRLRDVNLPPAEWGTKELADRYSKVIPGQPDDIGEAAPPGAEAEAFIKDNKSKFKKRYGDKWEQVLYATAWKVYGKNESVDEARSAGYKMPQSKDPYTVKYSKSKRGPIQTTVVDGEKAAKKFLADVKKQGMNGIITKGASQKEDVEQIGEAKAIKVRGGDAVEIGKSKRGGKVEYYWKAKNGLKNVFDSPEKLRYSLRNTANFSGAEKAVDQLGEAYKTPAEKKAERLAKIARAAAAREKDQAAQKEKATEKHNRASAKSRAQLGYRGNKDQFGRVREEEEVEEATRLGSTDNRMYVLGKGMDKANFNDRQKKNESVEIDEAKMGDIRREVRKGPSPYTVVAIVNNKVVDQDHAKIPDQVPAIVRELKKDNPRAKISVEDRSGKILHTEDVDVVEDRMGISEEVEGWVAIYKGKRLEIPNDGKVKGIAGAKAKAIKDLKVPKSKIGLLAIKAAVSEGRKSMVGRTKPSRELKTSREAKPHLAGNKSLKRLKRDAHKAERAKAKRDIRGYKDFSEASFMVNIDGIGKVVIDGTSAGEVKASLRKKLRSKDDLGSVERIGIASKKKHFMLKAKGKDKEEELEDEN